MRWTLGVSVLRQSQGSITAKGVRAAVESLNESTLPFKRNGKLTVQLVYSARLKVSERIYQVMQAQIDALGCTFEAMHLVFISYLPAHGYRALKIEGEDNKIVAQAKNALEELLAGQIAIWNGKTIWAPSFGINGIAYSKLKGTERTLGVAIIRDRRKLRFRIYGPPEKCKEAERLLAVLAEEDSSTMHTINLDH